MTREQAARQAVAELLDTHRSWRVVAALRAGERGGVETVRALWGCGSNGGPAGVDWDCLSAGMRVGYWGTDGERQRLEITKARVGQIAEELCRADVPRQMSLFEQVTA